MLLHAKEDSCELVQTTDGAGRYFNYGYRRVLLDGTGHFPTRESPAASAEAILEHLRNHRG